MKKIFIFWIILGFTVYFNGTIPVSGENVYVHNSLGETLTTKKLTSILGQVKNLSNESSTLKSFIDEIEKSNITLKGITDDTVNYLNEEFKNKENDWKYRWFILNQMSTWMVKSALELAEIGVEDENKEIKILSINTIGMRRYKKLLNKIVPLINYEDKEIQERALCAIGWIRDPESVEPVLLLYNNKETDNETRYIIMRNVFARIRGDEIYSLLIESLENNPDSKTRSLSASIIARYRKKDAIEPLKHSLMNDESPDVRYNAAFSLSILGGKEVIDILEKARDRESSPTKEKIGRLIELIETQPEEKEGKDK